MPCEITSARAILKPSEGLICLPETVSAGLERAARHHLVHGPRLILAYGLSPVLLPKIQPAFNDVSAPLLSDIKRMAALFEATSGQTALRVRLERITGDACKKFHVDMIDLRLLRSYVGAGVQWTHDDRQTVEEAATGAIVLLKGLRSPSWSDQLRVRHRSPPLSQRPLSDRQRLLLTIDAADACGGAQDARTVITV